MLKNWKRIVCAALSAVVCLNIVQPAAAVTKSELQRQQKNAQNKLDKANSNIGNLENEKADAQAEVEELDTELVTLIGMLDILEEEIADKEREIAQAQADYDIAKKDEEIQYAAMKQRIKYMYEKIGRASCRERV